MKIQNRTQSHWLATAIFASALGLGGCGAVDPSMSESEGDVETAEGELAAACGRDAIVLSSPVGIVDRSLTPPACCLGLNLAVVNNVGRTCSAGGTWKLFRNGIQRDSGSFPARDFRNPLDFLDFRFHFRYEKPFDVDLTIGRNAQRRYQVR
ncbi:MAG TPA: hypothetical protein VJV79_40030 [Polyangiaceae bacterium]|nr:hypothetical protein [Polyangiaceae bacterium]